MAYETQRRDYEQLPADGDVVEQADAHPRHHAILAAYAGLQRQELAFGLALILAQIARHLPDLDDELSGRPHAPARLRAVSGPAQGLRLRWEPH